MFTRLRRLFAVAVPVAVASATILMLLAAFGGNAPVSAHPRATSAVNPATCAQRKDIVPLSTAQGKADVMKILGPKEGAFVVSHMHQRFYSPDDCAGATPPVPSASTAAPGALSALHATHALGTSCCSIDSLTWGGFYIDETGQGTNTNAVATNYNAEFASTTYSLYQWDGIGGVNGNQDLLQTGTSMTNHKAFYCEWDAPLNYCDNTHTATPTFLFTTNQGDNIYAYVARTGVGVWEVLVEDTTLGGTNYYQKTFSFSPDHTTADWITELSTRNVAMPPFNQQTYTGDDWWDSNGNPIGYIHSLGSAPVIESVALDPVPGSNSVPTYIDASDFSFYHG